MRQKLKVKEETVESVFKVQCRHYWIIEIANGPKSQGVCQYCGEIRDFFNVIPDFTAPKRSTRPIDLPKLPDVEQDENSYS